MSVSIITTTYNDAHTIDRFIRSIVPQLRRGFEWVITDAHSDDGTWDAIENVAKGNKRIGAIRYDTQIPRGVGRHYGAGLSRGKVLIHAIDSDVIYRPGAMELVVKAFRRGGRKPIAGDSYFVISREDYFKVGGYPPMNVGEDFALYSFLSKAAIPVVSRRLNVWEEDHNDVRPLRNLAAFGSDENKTEPLPRRQGI